MAIFVQMARMLIAEHRNAPIAGTILLIGRQSVLMTPALALKVLAEEGVTPRAGHFIEIDSETVQANGAGYITDRSFLSMLTDATVISLDVSAYEGAEVVHDLNQPLPAEHEGIADFILNGSCLDNIFDPATAIKSLSRMLRPGGRMFSFELGTQAHGALVMYSPEWFFSFYAANNFAGCRIYLAHFDADLHDDYALYLWQPFYEQGGKIHASPMRAENGDFMLFVVAVKGADSTADKSPIQAFYRMMQEPAANGPYLERAAHYRESHPVVAVRSLPTMWRKGFVSRLVSALGIPVKAWDGVSGSRQVRVGERAASGSHFTYLGMLRNRAAGGANL